MGQMNTKPIENKYMILKFVDVGQLDKLLYKLYGLYTSEWNDTYNMVTFKLDGGVICINSLKDNNVLLTAPKDQLDFIRGVLK